jgi:hypothetical protein
MSAAFHSENQQEDQQLTALLHHYEQNLLDPSVRCDSAQVAALLAEDFIEIGASGRIWTRAAILDLLATESYIPPSIEDFRCTLLAENVALVTYRAVHEAGSATLRSSIWIKEKKNVEEKNEGKEHSRWRMRFHQGTK